MRYNIRNVGIDFLCAFLMFVIVGLLAFGSNLLGKVSATLAGLLFLLTQLSIVAGLIFFYLLTTHYKTGLTILSFLLNFLLWVTELVGLEDHFHNSYLYQDETVAGIFVLVLGTFLWTFNKILLDLIFLLFKPKLRQTRFEIFLKTRKANSIARQ